MNTQPLHGGEVYTHRSSNIHTGYTCNIESIEVFIPSVGAALTTEYRELSLHCPHTAAYYNTNTVYDTPVQIVVQTNAKINISHVMHMPYNIKTQDALDIHLIMTHDKDSNQKH